MLGKGEPAADRSDGTVQSQLAADEPAVQSALRQMAEGGQQGQSDRQIERWQLFGQIGGREVDEDAERGEVDAAGAKRCADPLARLADGWKGMKAQDLEMVWASGDLDLDMDGFGLDSPERCAADCTFLLEHGISLLDGA